MKTFVILLACAAALQADEIILRGGKSIEWKSIKQDEAGYEIVTAQGATLRFKRSEIEKVVLSSDAPLTGATITFAGKTKTQNLIAGIDPKRDAPKGKWKFGAGGTLVCESDVDVPTLLEVPCAIPAEYDISAIVERREGVDPFYIGLVGGGSQFLLEVDSAKSTQTGLTLGPGKDMNQNGTASPGGVLEVGKPRQVTVQVRADTVAVLLDGKELFRWKAAYDGCSLVPAITLPGKKMSLFIGTYKMTAVQKCSFTVTKLTLTQKL